MWELCKRKTKCQTCGKTMRKGERRYRSAVRRGRYMNLVYRCAVCAPIGEGLAPVENHGGRSSDPASETRVACLKCGDVFHSYTILRDHLCSIRKTSEDSKIKFLGRMLRPILSKKGE
jgi:hypothetical protein